VRFRILGPLEVWSGQAWSGISAPKWRALLAALLLNPGQVVSTDRLTDEIWGDDPPAKPSTAVAVYVLRLRRLIGNDGTKLLVTRPPGYLIRLEPDDLDASRFAALVSDGRKALREGAAERASAVLTDALALWRGQALADVRPSELVSAEASRLEESRVAAVELRVEAELACGRGAAAVADLQRLAADHPLREELWALLMRALCAAGRQAEALDTYERARIVIAEQLGVDPGTELKGVYRQILEADSETAVAPAVPSTALSAGRAHPALGATADPAAPAPLVPSQLPADIPDFTGRGEHVKFLSDLLSDAPEDDDPGAVAVGLVVGTGGLGKTTLAVHAAHRLRTRFPDGQLYMNLRGASEQPVQSADVLARFLRDLGVAGSNVPVGEDERAALYRSRLAGMRMLIVLDDARDAAQVRPLLPGSSSCGVLVTSRHHVPGLVGARTVDLDVLDHSEAHALLVRIVGAERLAAEPAATTQVLAACAGLPLAIRIAGARLAARANWTVQTLARRLTDERRRIDEFKVGDLAVRACFQVSFNSLPRASGGAVDPARVFRLLGLWQGPSISLQAAAALLGEPEDDVADALEVLVDAHLLQSPAAERYRFHDLLRVYAAEQAESEEMQQHREEAVLRILIWYLYTAAAADRLIAPHREKVQLEPLPAGCLPMTFADITSAIDWCEVERTNVVAATAQAAASGLNEIGWKLPVAANGFLNRRSHWADCITTHRIALASARQLGDRHGEAWVLNNLGMVLMDQRREGAISYYEEALAIRRAIGDRRGEAQAANNLAYTYQLLGRAGEAINPLLHALDLQRQIGHRYGESVALSNLGAAYIDLGRVDEAAECLREALAVAREIESPRVEGYVLTDLGRARLSTGRIEEAIGCLQQAIERHRRVGDRSGEARDLKYLGHAQQRAGRAALARQAWSDAHVIFRDLGDDAQAAEVRAELEVLVS